MQAHSRNVLASAMVAATLFAYAATPTRAAGLIIQVTTTADTQADDGFCSLREAIQVSNTGGSSGVQTGECQGTTGIDRIQFSIGSGTPTINIGSDLPMITQAVNILGNSGGATRVELHGPGSGHGLYLNGASNAAGGTTIRGLVVDNFSTGIKDLSTDATVAGNVIGPNNGGGIDFSAGGVATIGGINSGSPTPCSGDCNVIVGNVGGGVVLTNVNDGSTVRGNFIGVNASGTAASGNSAGVVVHGGAVAIGGAAPGARNVISGNLGDGVYAFNTRITIRNNYIGTDVTGTLALPNTQRGVEFDSANVTVGGGPGEGNVISGNYGPGIYVTQTQGQPMLIIGNRIGTKATSGPLGNHGDGIYLDGTAHEVNNVKIGLASVKSSLNYIANNAGAGVHIAGSPAYGPSDYNAIRANSIHDNGRAGILFTLVANDQISAPTVTGTSPVGGSACASCEVDVFSDNADEGSTYQGTVLADENGHWTFTGPVKGPFVTATQTDYANNTSPFSAPLAIPVFKPDGRIRAGGGPLVGDNIYNVTATNQMVTGSAAPGATVSFPISIQNDSRSESFLVKASGSPKGGYTVRYYQGATEQTSAIVAGTFRTPILAQGGTFALTAVVSIDAAAPAGSSVDRLVLLTAVDDHLRQDAVRFVASRT